MQKDLEVEDQRPDEEIIVTMRQHPWVLARPAFYLTLIFAAVFVIFLIFNFSTFSFSSLIVAVCFGLIYVSVSWYTYSNDLFILTNQRLIKIDQKSFFNRRVSETELDNVYNINYEVKGIIKSLLNFGDVKISTVGDDVSTIFIYNIENPHYIQERIMDLHKKYKVKIYS
jgi:hypothetical protein